MPQLQLEIAARSSSEGKPSHLSFVYLLMETSNYHLRVRVNVKGFEGLRKKVT